MSIDGPPSPQHQSAQAELTTTSLDQEFELSRTVRSAWAPGEWMTENGKRVRAEEAEWKHLNTRITVAECELIDTLLDCAPQRMRKPRG